MSVKNNFFIGILTLLFLALSACSGGGGGSTPPPPDTTNPPVTISKSTFTGIIRQSSGNALPGVTITLEGTSQSTTTDANGIFALPETLSGDYVIDIDGTTATGDSGTSFGILKIAATVGTEETTSLNQVITLPDLSNRLTAIDSVRADAGTIAGGIAAANGTILLGSGGLDVLMQIDGADVEGSVNVSATPVPLADLPMALPVSAGANAGSFVTIQPPTATFDPALDLTIPNDLGLPPGTLVDIYSFDHDLNDWVNRSAEFTPPHQGEVSTDGTIIEAKNVISKGGWHGPVVVIPGYIETVIGFVMNGDTPLQGALVFTSTGQQGVTNADGSFSILVPVPGTSTDVSVTATSNGFNGAVSTTTPELPTVDDGTPLDFGVIDLAIPTTGIVSGIALQNGSPSTQPVTISNDTFTQILTPDVNGAFTLSGLPAGAYTASTTFSGDTQATTTSFNIVAGRAIVITLQNSSGNNIIVKAILGGGNFSNPIPANDSDRQVTVTLSQGGTTITQTTDASGLAIFNNITGMVTVTGQIDETDDGSTARLAVTIHDITPINGQIRLPISLLPAESSSVTPVQGTAITGTLLDIPPVPVGFELVVFAREKNDRVCCNASHVQKTIPTALISGGTVDYTLNNRNGIIAGSYTIAAVIRLEDLNPGTTQYDSAAIFPTPVITTNGTVLTDVNLSFTHPTTGLEFTTKEITVNNLQLAASSQNEVLIENTLLLASGEEFIFETYSSTTLSFPTSSSFISTFPGGARVSYDLETGNTNNLFFIGTGQARNASLIPSDATTATFNLITPPIISAPTDGQTLTLNAANDMIIDWTDSGSIDLVLVQISSLNTNAAPGEISASVWIHYAPGDSASRGISVVQASTLPVFATNNQYNLTLKTVRFDETINYNQLFDFDTNTNTVNVFQNGNSESSSLTQSFTIAP